MKHFKTFAVALGVEMCGAGYTVAVAKNQMWLAVCLSAIGSLMGYGLFLSVIDNRKMLFAAMVGEVIGTIVVMGLAQALQGG